MGARRLILLGIGILLAVPLLGPLTANPSIFLVGPGITVLLVGGGAWLARAGETDPFPVTLLAALGVLPATVAAYGWIGWVPGQAKWSWPVLLPTTLTAVAVGLPIGTARSRRQQLLGLLIAFVLLTPYIGVLTLAVMVALEFGATTGASGAVWVVDSVALVEGFGALGLAVGLFYLCYETGRLTGLADAGSLPSNRPIVGCGLVFLLVHDVWLVFVGLLAGGLAASPVYWLALLVFVLLTLEAMGRFGDLPSPVSGRLRPGG